MRTVATKRTLPQVIDALRAPDLLMLDEREIRTEAAMLLEEMADAIADVLEARVVAIRREQRIAPTRLRLVLQLLHARASEWGIR